MLARTDLSKKLTGKCVLITGGSRGIGKAIALACAREGADVVITFREQNAQADLVVDEIQGMGCKALAICADITNEKDRKKIVNESEQAFGRIDVLVNNAGVYWQKDFLKISETEYDKMMDVNLKSHFFLTKAVSLSMIARGVAGSIINISSFRDKTPTPELMHYQLSKAGLTYFSKGLALALAEHGIRSNTISPGAVKTDMNRFIRENKPEEWAAREKSIPLGFIGNPEDICSQVITFASDESRYTTGARVVIDGGRSLNASVIRAKL